MRDFVAGIVAFALLVAAASLASGVILVWFPLKRWLGNLGRIRDFGEQLGQQGGKLNQMQSANAPLEFRQTFDILNRADPGRF